MAKIAIADVPLEPINRSVPEFSRIFVLYSRTDEDQTVVTISAHRDYLDVLVDIKAVPDGSTFRTGRSGGWSSGCGT